MRYGVRLGREQVAQQPLVLATIRQGPTRYADYRHEPVTGPNERPGYRSDIWDAIARFCVLCLLAKDGVEHYPDEHGRDWKWDDVWHQIPKGGVVLAGVGW